MYIIFEQINVVLNVYLSNIPKLFFSLLMPKFLLPSINKIKRKFFVLNIEQIQGTTPVIFP